MSREISTLPQILRLKVDSDAFCKFNKSLSAKQIRNIVRITNAIQRCMSEEACINVSEMVYIDADDAAEPHNKPAFCNYMETVMRFVELPPNMRAFQSRLKTYDMDMFDFYALDKMEDEEKIFQTLKRIWNASAFRKKNFNAKRWMGVTFLCLLASTCGLYDQSGTVNQTLMRFRQHDPVVVTQTPIFDTYPSNESQEPPTTIYTTLPEYQEEESQEESEEIKEHRPAEETVVCHLRKHQDLPLDKKGAPLEVDKEVRALPTILWRSVQRRISSKQRQLSWDEIIDTMADFLTGLPAIPQKYQRGLQAPLFDTDANDYTLEANWYINAYSSGWTEDVRRFPKKGDSIGSIGYSERERLTSLFKPKEQIFEPAEYYAANLVFPLSMLYQLNFRTELFILLRQHHLEDQMQQVWAESSKQWLQGKKLTYPFLDRLLCEMYQWE